MSPPISLRSFEERDADAVVALWRACGLVVPWNDPYADIARKCAFEGGLFTVGLVADRIAGSVMAGWEGHRGWLNYLAVAPDHRGRGFGRLLVRHAEAQLAELGCPKVNLQVRAGNRSAIGFYRALGYSLDEVVSLGRRLE